MKGREEMQVFSFSPPGVAGGGYTWARLRRSCLILSFFTNMYDQTCSVIICTPCTKEKNGKKIIWPKKLHTLLYSNMKVGRQINKPETIISLFAQIGVFCSSM